MHAFWHALVVFKHLFSIKMDLLPGLSEGNARGINSAWFFFCFCFCFVFVFVFFSFSHKMQFHYSACVKCRRMRRMYLSLRNIKRNLLYQTSYLILCLHVNTTVYLDVIENPVEYQKLLWNVSEERTENWRNLFMSVFVQAYRSHLGTSLCEG